jgi:alpha-amylase
MLAWPHGYPRVMSSYAFDDGDAGPPELAPLTGGGDCAEGWICEHRSRTVVGLVGFRNATDAAFHTDHWWSNDNDQIAFARGDRGFFVMNREELSTVDRTFQTGLRPGIYCDVTTGMRRGRRCTGRSVVVGEGGWAPIQIGSLDVLAIHAGSRL